MMTDKRNLLRKISEASFAQYEALLFLDTHPDNKEALDYFNIMTAKRKELMSEYGRCFGPLTADMAGNSGCWDWNNCPMPWEREV